MAGCFGSCDRACLLCCARLAFLDAAAAAAAVSRRSSVAPRKCTRLVRQSLQSMFVHRRGSWRSERHPRVCGLRRWRMQLGAMSMASSSERYSGKAPWCACVSTSLGDGDGEDGTGEGEPSSCSTANSMCEAITAAVAWADEDEGAAEADDDDDDDDGRQHGGGGVQQHSMQCPHRLGRRRRRPAPLVDACLAFGCWPVAAAACAAVIALAEVVACWCCGHVCVCLRVRCSPPPPWRGCDALDSLCQGGVTTTMGVDVLPLRSGPQPAARIACTVRWPAIKSRATQGPCEAAPSQGPERYFAISTHGIFGANRTALSSAEEQTAIWKGRGPVDFPHISGGGNIFFLEIRWTRAHQANTTRICKRLNKGLNGKPEAWALDRVQSVGRTCPSILRRRAYDDISKACVHIEGSGVTLDRIGFHIPSELL